jgi:hypothetical protein
MQTTPMDKAAEARLISAVREINGLVEGGSDPTDAIIKIAQQHRFLPQTVPLLVNAYNVGRTAWQQEVGSGILGKQAEFPIARLEAVQAALYPEKSASPGELRRQTAVSADYSRPPSPHLLRKLAACGPSPATIAFKLVKQAAVRESPVQRVDRSLKKLAEDRRTAEHSRQKVAAAKERTIAHLGQVRDYFKQASQDRLPYAAVAHNARLLFGNFAEPILKFAYADAQLREPQQLPRLHVLQPATLQMQPYQQIKAAIDSALALAGLETEQEHLQKSLTLKLADAVPSFSPPSRGASPLLGTADSSESKAAGFLTNALSAGLGATARGAVPSATEPRESAIQKTQLALTDPSHMQALRGIETQVMLNDMLSNDEVLSSYDPDQVLTVYNELARMGPRLAQQPAVMRPLLRKYMTQGGIEPFEAQQITDMEKSMVGAGDNMLPSPAPPAAAAAKRTPEVLGGKSLFG